MPDVIYYTYKVTFSNGDYYIGRRKCPKGSTPETDEYLGSPVTNKRRWLEEIPSKQILNTFDNEIDYAIDEEKQLGDKWKLDPKCLNNSPANLFSSSGLVWCNDGENDFMLPESKAGGYNIGRLGTSAKGKKYYTNGVESRMFNEGDEPAGWVLGNHNSLAEKNGMYDKEPYTKGKVAYNNGTDVIFIHQGEVAPNGFRKGFPDSFKEKRSLSTKGKSNPRYGSRGEKWYNDGNTNKLCVPGNEPDGFVKGMVKKNVKR